jgi:hypothetical protein
MVLAEIRGGLVLAIVSALAACGGSSGSSAPPAAQSGSDVTVSWTSPSQNTDGSPLNDLHGYRVRYGTSPTNLSRSTDVPNASATSVAISGLTSGTWYFAVTALNAAGIESDLSNLATKTVP